LSLAVKRPRVDDGECASKDHRASERQFGLPPPTSSPLGDAGYKQIGDEVADVQNYHD